MGYSTEFIGQFKLDKPLDPKHSAYLCRLAATRRMLRDEKFTETLHDPLRLAVGLPVGKDGEFYVGSLADFGQDFDRAIDSNSPPSPQPGVRLQWVPSEDGTAIEWDGCEKFHGYAKWLKYIIVNLLQPWGYTMNGTVDWRGDDADDRGRLIVTDNVVRVSRAKQLEYHIPAPV